MLALAVSNAANTQKPDQSPIKHSPGQTPGKGDTTRKSGTQQTAAIPGKGNSPRKGDTTGKVLRPSLSKIAVNSLEFSETLPFAAFASLLLEMVARLDFIIQEVEELGRLANFKEKPDIEIVVSSTPVNVRTDGGREFPPHLPSHFID